MSTAQPARGRDLGRLMMLYSVIVAVLAGVIAPAIKQDLGADTATIGLISTISMLMVAAFIFGGVVFEIIDLNFQANHYPL